MLKKHKKNVLFFEHTGICVYFCTVKNTHGMHTLFSTCTPTFFQRRIIFAKKTIHLQPKEGRTHS